MLVKRGGKMTLEDQIRLMARRRGDDYRPRTRHLDDQGRAIYTNRLFLESSPYLLQHAHNPVDWYPWGDEAFDTARRLDRPVLLSVGYSTCHWCHVMEEESFEDIDIARYINENYIAVKVDREERPDVDAIYMSAVQAITGRGGWPMTVWLTPDRKPFYGGTYFPARDGDRGSPVGFLTMLKKIRQSYDEKRDLIAQSAGELARAVAQMLTPTAGGRLPLDGVMERAVSSSKNRFDAVNGGIAGSPKFPSSLPIRLLLRHHLRTGDADSLKMAVLTLEPAYLKRAKRGFSAFSTQMEANPSAFGEMLLAFEDFLHPPHQVIVVTPAGGDAASFKDRLRCAFLPGSLVMIVSESHAAKLALRSPLFKDKIAAGGKATAYVCQNGACRLPVATGDALMQQLTAS
jgi:uncharacterized protein YyaL (SSP411 family)